ncbi:MAG TPA: DUF4349 domain-containing protein [Ilumatobacteraceae bacterium]
MNTAHSNRTARGIRIAAALAAAIIGVTGCGGADDKSSSMTVPIPTHANQVDAPSATEAAAIPGDPSTGGSGIDTIEPLPEERFLAIDVTFGLEVDDMTTATDAVVALAARHAGRIDDRSINITDDRSSTASFVIKLPPSEVESAIADLDSIGTRRTVSQGTEDVTSQVVDIDARLATAQASLERVRKLLEAATDLGQVLSLESQLTERETAVEKYQAMKRAISERTSLATLRVNLSLSPEPAAKVAPDKHEDTTIGTAFRSGWHGFVMALAAILIFIGYTAPFLVVLGLALGLTIPFIRRRTRTQPPRPMTPPSPRQTDPQAETRASQPVDVNT